MSKKSGLLATVAVSVLVSGCANHSVKFDEWWKCALAGGAVGGAGGSLESSETAALGAAGGALLGGLICAFSGEPKKDMDCPFTVPGWDIDLYGCPKDSDGDGIPDALDKCPGTPPGTKVGPDGCPVPPPQPAVPAFEGETLHPVLFETSSSSLSDQAKMILDRGVSIMKEHPDSQVRIVGYTDSSGPAAFNQKLSESRSLSVRSYLVDNGIQPSRITVHGDGADDPVADNHTREGRKLNRRVEVEIVGGK